MIQRALHTDPTGIAMSSADAEPPTGICTSYSAHANGGGRGCGCGCGCDEAPASATVCVHHVLATRSCTEVNKGAQVTGWAKTLQVGPLCWLQIPIDGLKLALLLGQPCDFRAKVGGCSNSPTSSFVGQLAPTLRLPYHYLKMVGVCHEYGRLPVQLCMIENSF
jgi:hypothetical protein